MPVRVHKVSSHQSRVRFANSVISLIFFDAGERCDPPLALCGQIQQKRKTAAGSAQAAATSRHARRTRPAGGFSAR